MIFPATTPSAPGIFTYDRSGSASFRSEPGQRYASASGQGRTTTEDYQDTVTLSQNGLEQARQQGNSEGETGTAVDASASPGVDRQKTAGKTVAGVHELTTAEEKEVQQLKERDQEVKNHEMAHLANAGQYARGGPTYSYQQGPDGRKYAVGGEVPIDISKEKTPEQTIQKMETVRRAAMAPADPSSADRRIAAAAAAMEAQAQQEIQNARADHDATSGHKAQASGEHTANTTAVSDLTHRPRPIDIAV